MLLTRGFVLFAAAGGLRRTAMRHFDDLGDDTGATAGDLMVPVVVSPPRRPVAGQGRSTAQQDAEPSEQQIPPDGQLGGGRWGLLAGSRITEGRWIT